mgnify:FL=1|jgi:chromosome segregation ATPase|tara:strand:+ start:1500 stop:1751 length:252 start_codon:yes stop_codon:yes gene_type:complete
MEGNGHQRELGQFFQEVKELRHDYQSLKTVINMLDENQRNLERELMSLRGELKTFQAKLMTMGSVSIAVITAGAWVIQIFFQP